MEHTSILFIFHVIYSAAYFFYMYYMSYTTQILCTAGLDMLDRYNIQFKKIEFLCPVLYQIKILYFTIWLFNQTKFISSIIRYSLTYGDKQIKKNQTHTKKPPLPSLFYGNNLMEIEHFYVFLISVVEVNDFNLSGL